MFLSIMLQLYGFHWFWLLLCGIRYRVSVRVYVRVRLKVLLTRLTLGVSHAFKWALVREWLARTHYSKN